VKDIIYQHFCASQVVHTMLALEPMASVQVERPRLSIIFLLIILMITNILNINMSQELILVSASQRNPILWPYSVPLIKVYANWYERLDWCKSAKR
jgi:hypothetical protein